MRKTIERLKPLFTDKPTVENPFKIPEKIQWVAPQLVCEVAFAEWTEDEQLRQTTFLGWRDDKDPKELHQSNIRLSSAAPHYLFRGSSAALIKVTPAGPVKFIWTITSVSSVQV
jgi:ATP-dependent DNA ligase